MALCAGVLLAAPALAQESAPAVGPAAFDLTTGAGAGVGGGTFRQRGGANLDFVVGVRRRALRRGALVVGASAGFQGPLAPSGPCAPDTARTACPDDFPVLGYYGALAGWESVGARRRGAGGVRLLAGLAFVNVDGANDARLLGRTAGFEARADATTPALGPFALVVAARGLLVPRFDGKTFGHWGYGLGVRVR